MNKLDKVAKLTKISLEEEKRNTYEKFIMVVLDDFFKTIDKKYQECKNNNLLIDECNNSKEYAKYKVKNFGNNISPSYEELGFSPEDESGYFVLPNIIDKD